VWKHWTTVAGLCLLCSLPVTAAHADLWDDARKATRTDLAFQDSAGGTIRGGLTFATGQQQATVTLFRGTAQIGGTCGSFDLKATLKEAFEAVPEFFEQAGRALIYNFPILAVCYLEPTICDAFKHYQSLINAVVQAKYAQCQSVQNAMASAGLRLRGGESARCLEDQQSAGASLSQALDFCNGPPPSLRRPNGTRGAEVHLLEETLQAAGASSTTQTLATSLVGDITLRAGGTLAATTQRPQAALLARFESHKADATTALQSAVDSYRTTGTVSPEDLQALTVPGQPFPRAALDALATLQHDPVRRDTLLSKLATSMALARLTWDCADLEEQLASAADDNPHLGDEERRLLESRRAALQRNLGQFRQKLEAAERHQTTLDEVMRAYATAQQTATDYGLRAPSTQAPVMPYRFQNPFGYGQ
jgi:hypothetical protein